MGGNPCNDVLHRCEVREIPSRSSGRALKVPLQESTGHLATPSPAGETCVPQTHYKLGKQASNDEPRPILQPTTPSSLLIGFLQTSHPTHSLWAPTCSCTPSTWTFAISDPEICHIRELGSSLAQPTVARHSDLVVIVIATPRTRGILGS